MRAFSVSRVLFVFAFLLAIPCAVAQQTLIDDNAAVPGDWPRIIDRESEQPSPPAPPLPFVRASVRYAMPTGEIHEATPLDPPGPPSDTTVFLPLSAGLSVVSLPMVVPSEKLSDIFPNLPQGSRAWVWDGAHQRFVEGLENELPLGRACWLYVPVPVVLAVTGRPNTLLNVSFDLQKGWNLIGVPYDMPLLRSQQHVYVDWARKPFNDAVAANDVDPLIFTFDVNGYETVDADGSFEPLRGYWVYARRAELLEIRRPGLFDTPTPIPWGSVLGPAGSMVSNMILTQMGLSDTAKLLQILGKLDTITNNQTLMSAKLDQVLYALQLSESQILQAIDESNSVVPVQVALLSYYDQEGNQPPRASLAWFVKQARDGNGATVSTQTKSEFAKLVLNDAKFIEKFNMIKAGIVPISASGKGLLDNFADQVVLTSDQYTLQNRYLAMESFFSTLLGMQIKCATLIMNAYDQLASDPASNPDPAHITQHTAAEWKANTFDPAIKEETERFLQAVEGVAVRKLPVPQTWDAPPVKVPDEVQVMLGSADLYVMQTLMGIYPDLEPPGVRVRVMLNPGAGADIPTVGWIPTGAWLPHYVALPSFDTWRTYVGAGEYDDWTLPASSNTRAFKVTSDWKSVRIILPVTAPGAVTTWVRGNSAWWRANDDNDSIFKVSADRTSGYIFGSVTTARRPSAVDAFDPCLDWPITTEVTQYCDPYTGDCDRKGLDSCNRRSFHPTDIRSTLTMTYDFTYQGSVPKASTWRANGVGAVDDNSLCTWWSTTYALTTGTYPPLGVNIWSSRPGGVLSTSVTWAPGQTYKFVVQLQPQRLVSNQCTLYWSHKGTFMTFP